MKVFAAVPAYDCKVGVETVRSLLNEQLISHLAGVELQVAFQPGTSLITMARNQICAEFLATDAERLVMVDADVSWEPGDLLRLAAWPKDVVGGAYRYKREPVGYPVHFDSPGEPFIADETGNLVQVKHLPGGFLAISRGALQRFIEAYPERAYTHEGKSAHAFFTAPYRDGCLYGEDSAFCADWKAAGGEVWLDPELLLTHSDGLHQFTGRIGDWFRTRT